MMIAICIAYILGILGWFIMGIGDPVAERIAIATLTIAYIFLMINLSNQDWE